MQRPEPDRNLPAADQFRNGPAPVSQEGGTEGGALRHVLEETLASLENEEHLSAQEREALFAVARRYARQPFRLQPMGTELVEAVLRRQLPTSWCKSSVFQPLCQQIAEVLCEDPTARNRLEQLWLRLGGG